MNLAKPAGYLSYLTKIFSHYLTIEKIPDGVDQLMDSL